MTWKRVFGKSAESSGALVKHEDAALVKHEKAAEDARTARRKVKQKEYEKNRPKRTRANQLAVDSARKEMAEMSLVSLVY